MARFNPVNVNLNITSYVLGLKAHNPKVVSSNLARATNIHALKAGSKRPLHVGVSLLCPICAQFVSNLCPQKSR